MSGYTPRQNVSDQRLSIISYCKMVPQTHPSLIKKHPCRKSQLSFSGKQTIARLPECLTLCGVRGDGCLLVHTPAFHVQKHKHFDKPSLQRPRRNGILATTYGYAQTAATRRGNAHVRPNALTHVFEMLSNTFTGLGDIMQKNMGSYKQCVLQICSQLSVVYVSDF